MYRCRYARARACNMCIFVYVHIYIYYLHAQITYDHLYVDNDICYILLICAQCCICICMYVGTDSKYIHILYVDNDICYILLILYMYMYVYWYRSQVYTYIRMYKWINS